MSEIVDTPIRDAPWKYPVLEAVLRATLLRNQSNEEDISLIFFKVFVGQGPKCSSSSFSQSDSLVRSTFCIYVAWAKSRSSAATKDSVS
jgi:hypothetical protein